jgi:hypothetical protein
VIFHSQDDNGIRELHIDNPTGRGWPERLADAAVAAVQKGRP